jgi:hypothetical protein
MEPYLGRVPRFVGTLPEFVLSEDYPYSVDNAPTPPEAEASTSKGAVPRIPSPMDTDTVALPFAGASSITPMTVGKYFLLKHFIQKFLIMFPFYRFFFSSRHQESQ